VVTANAPTDSISNDDVAVATAEDGVVIDDSEILDGTETEEYISTY
jgi:hypothetical protein